DWMKSSWQGNGADGHHANHGTWFDAQFMAYTLYAGEPWRAKSQVNHPSNGPYNRIPNHFNTSGVQVNEVTRTRSWHYSLFNLEAFFTVAQLAEHVGED